MRDVNIKAVILGIVVSLVVILLLSGLLLVVLGSHLFGQQMSEAESQQAVRAFLLEPVTLFWSFVAGIGATALGAFTVVRVARRALFANIVAFLGVSVLLTLFSTDAGYPLWVEAVGLVLMLPAAYLGVFLGSRPRSARRPADS